MKLRTAISMLILFSLTQIVFAQTAAEKISTASISGRVTVGDKPLPNVLITLNEQYSRLPREGLGTRTDEDGNYKITGVTAGRYFISARALTYVMPNGNQYSQGISVIIGANEIIDKQDFQLKPGGVIAGKILDAEGRPAIGQKITLRVKAPNSQQSVPFQNNINYQALITDDRGIYRIFGLPPGKYFVTIGIDPQRGADFIGSNIKAYPLTYYPSVSSEDKAETVEVSEGSEAKDIDITVGKSSQLFQAKGRIIDANSGQPLVGVQLMGGPLVKEGNRERVANWTSRSERTNTNGEFTLSGLVPSTYAVTMLQEEGFEYFADATTFEVIASNLENVQLNARPGASISGILVLEGEKNPAIQAQLKNLRINYSTENNLNQIGSGPPRVNADGTFQLRGLKPGKGRLNISVYAAYPDFIVLRCEKDGIVLPASFEVMEKAKITGVRLVVGYAAGSISGQVTITGGTLPPNAFLNLHARPLNPALTDTGFKGAQVSANGRFVIDKLLPGEYEVVLNPPYVQNQQIRAKPVKQKVMVANNIEATVTLTLDLSEGGQQ